MVNDFHGKYTDKVNFLLGREKVIHGWNLLAISI
jgi:hypothetical protein